VNGIEQRYFLTTKPGKTGSYLQKRSADKYYQIAKPDELLFVNSIPLHIRQSQTYSSFRRHLKMHYFISAHVAP